MKISLRALAYWILSLSVTLLPILLLAIAGVVDYVNDLGKPFSIFVRYIPIHLVLLGLFFWSIRGLRKSNLTLLVEQRSSKLRETLLALFVALVLVFIIFWPVSNWSSQLFGGSGDGYNWRWQIWRMSQEFRHGNFFPTRFNDVIAPYGVDLRLNDGYLSMYIGGLWNLLAKPTLAYNLTLATSVFLNFFSARRLALRVNRSHSVALIAGLMMATAPSITMRQLGHLNLCFTFVLCLSFLESIYLITRTKIRIWQTGLILGLAFLSSFYFFILSALIYSICALIRVTRTVALDRDSTKSDVTRLLSVGLLVLLLVTPFVITRLHHDNAESRAGAPSASARTDEYMFYSADPRTFFLPPVDAKLEQARLLSLRRNTSPNTVENTPFPGYLALVSIALLLVLVSKWRELIALFWAFFSLLALGPTLIWGAEAGLTSFFPHSIVESATGKAVSWLPYMDLALLPGLSALRTPNRFAMVLPVIGVFAFAMIAERLREVRSGSVFSFSIACLAILLLVPNLRENNYWYPTRFSDTDQRALLEMRADKTNSRVVVAGPNCLQTISMANLQIEHRHPIVGCQTFSAAVPWYSGIGGYKKSSAMSQLQCDPSTFGLAPMNPNIKEIPPNEIFNELRKTLNIGYVVFPKNLACSDASRSEYIQKIMRGNARVIDDSKDYLIISI